MTPSTAVAATELKDATPQPAPTTGYRYAVLAMLTVAYTFNFIDRQILGILAGPIKAELGISDTQMGLMGGLAFAAFYSTIGIPVAIVADRWSRTWIMTGALTLWSAFTAACGLVTGFVPLFWPAWAWASAKRAAWRRPTR